MSVNYGSKRVVVGAHYGLRDWLASLPYVERVADAERGDGGPGCSVVWVK